MAEEKTNVMRILDKEKISYKAHFYPHGKEAVDGVTVAQLLNQNPLQVFKTLVTKGTGRNYYVFVIPVAKELDLKKAARAVCEKSVEMIPVADINKVTGYIRGGCSPVGMKKLYPTVFDESCLDVPAIMVSAGKIGSQIETKAENLIKLVNGRVADLVF